MLGRRGFLKALFGVSLGAVTRGMGDVVEALTTRKEANRVLNYCTVSEICDAKFFVLPYIELCEPLIVEESLYAEETLSEASRSKK